jgi:hypothetical protein
VSRYSTLPCRLANLTFLGLLGSHGEGSTFPPTRGLAGRTVREEQLLGKGVKRGTTPGVLGSLLNNIKTLGSQRREKLPEQVRKPSLPPRIVVPLK